MNRVLQTFIDQMLVGELFENGGVWSFQYDAQWVRDGFELSPGIPLKTQRLDDGASIRPVQWFFDNLLPEEDARQQIFASIEHRQTQRVIPDAWTILEQFGAESAGALTLLKPGSTLPEAGLLPLSDIDLETRIKAMPRQPLAAKAPKKMSLAGAQQKLPVVLVDGKLFEPTGSMASTHILKPDVLSEHYPCSAVNEWFSARLAKDMGLLMPEVELRFVPSPVYIIARFDRTIKDGQVKRLHTLDAVQLLTMSASAKYQQSGIKALIDVLARCRIPATARITLFRWTLFNILIGNSDAHLKNLSLIATPGGYELAPHYDLLSTAAWSRPELLGQGEVGWPDIAMSYAIDGVMYYKDLRKAHLQAFAKVLGVPSTAFNRECTRMIANIEAAAVKLYEEFEARKDVPANLRASHSRMLRCIRHLPIQTMAQQLRGDV